MLSNLSVQTSYVQEGTDPGALSKLSGQSQLVETHNYFKSSPNLIFTVSALCQDWIFDVISWLNKLLLHSIVVPVIYEQWDMKLKLTAKSLWTNGEMVARSVHSNDRWETDFNHKLHSYLQVAALRPSALNPKCFLAFEVITQETWNSFLGTRKRWWWLGIVNVELPRVKLCLTNL